MLGKTAIYQAFGSRGCLLYVGISKNVAARIRQHKTSSEWWSKTCTLKIHFADSRQEAQEQERLLVAEHGPKFNSHLQAKWPGPIKERVYGATNNHVSISAICSAAKCNEKEAWRALFELTDEGRLAKFESQRTDDEPFFFSRLDLADWWETKGYKRIA